MRLWILVVLVWLGLGAGSLWAAAPLDTTTLPASADTTTLPVSAVGWLQTQGARKAPANTLDPSLPPPISNSTIPPVEWPLVVLQSFSGMIVAGVGSFLLQTLMDLILIGPIITPEKAETSGVASTLVVLAVMPWIIGGTVYGLGLLSNNYRGSFWWSLLGAYIGEAVAMGVGLLLNFADQSETKSTSRLIRFLLDGLLIGVGAVLFYTLFRYPLGNVQQIGSLLQYRQGAWAWGVPLPQISNIQDNTTVTIPILSGRF